MKVIHLQKGVEYLREFIKKAQKHMPDRNNRGYPDAMLHLNDVLDGLEDLMKYVDEPQLNYYKRITENVNCIDLIDEMLIEQEKRMETWHEMPTLLKDQRLEYRKHDSIMGRIKSLNDLKNKLRVKQ